MTFDQEAHEMLDALHAKYEESGRSDKVTYGIFTALAMAFWPSISEQLRKEQYKATVAMLDEPQVVIRGRRLVAR